MVGDRWPDANEEMFIVTVGTFLAIYTEGGYDAQETLETIKAKYESLIGPLPTNQGRE